MKLKTRPVRVLHIIDTLGGGGSERLIFDIVRFSDSTRVKHRVVTIFRDGYLVPFIYAEPLRQLGAYGKADHSRPTPATAPSAAGEKSVKDATLLKSIPPALKKPLVGIYNFAFSTWQRVKRYSAHVPAMFTIPVTYFRFRPDIVHVHGFYSFKYGLLFKTLFKRPMVHPVPALFSQMEAQGTGWLVNRYRQFHPL